MSLWDTFGLMVLSSISVTAYNHAFYFIDFQPLANHLQSLSMHAPITMAMVTMLPDKPKT